MSDPSKVVRWQSAGLIVAALISTTGAVSSALIQTGWFGKEASDTTISTSPPVAATAQATFAGFIERVSEQPIAAAEISMPAASSAPTVTPAMFVSGPLVSQESNKKKQELINWKSIPRFLESLK